MLNKGHFGLRYATVKFFLICFLADFLLQLLSMSILTQTLKTCVSRCWKVISMRNDSLAKRSNDKGTDAGQTTKALAS